MSSDCPPQLQLSIQPTTTSFKRSFEEFGFDLESPVGARSANGAGESAAGSERHKRARSRTSLGSEANGSAASSAVSDSGSNVVAREPTTTVEPPRLPTPVLPDVDMPSYHEDDDEQPFPVPPTQSIDPTPTNAFQLTLDRFNAFDREMQVLRQPEPNLSSASSSSSSSASALVAPAPPVLPPLIIDPHRLSPEAIDFLPEQSPRNPPQAFPLSLSVSGVNLSSSALPDRSRESASPPVRFRQNLDVALERLRSPSPLAPGFVFHDSPTPEDDDDIHRHQSPPPTIARGPPTLPPIPPITNDLQVGNGEASNRNEAPARPHVVLVPLDPPTLPPIPTVSEAFPDTSNVWDDDTAPPPQQPHTARHPSEDLPPFRPLSPEIPAGYIDFERDFGQWFHPAEDSMSSSSVSTSAATAGTEREPFGLNANPAPLSSAAATAMPTSPQSPTASPLSMHILRARQAVEERGMRLSRIAAAETVAARRSMLRSSAAASASASASASSSRAGPSNANAMPALRPDMMDEYGRVRVVSPHSAARLLPPPPHPDSNSNVRPSFNFRYNDWEDRRRNSLELPTPEDRRAPLRDRLAHDIEDTEYRLRRRPRFLHDGAENPEPHTTLSSSHLRSEPDDANANANPNASPNLNANPSTAAVPTLLRPRGFPLPPGPGPTPLWDLAPGAGLDESFGDWLARHGQPALLAPPGGARARARGRSRSLSPRAGMEDVEPLGAWMRRQGEPGVVGPEREDEDDNDNDNEEEEAERGEARSLEYIRRLSARVEGASHASTRRWPTSVAWASPSLAHADDANSHSDAGMTLAGLGGGEDRADRALWRPGPSAYAPPGRRFGGGEPLSLHNAMRRGAALPRPSASNSLVAESASEARRQADFESITVIRRRNRSPAVRTPWQSAGGRGGGEEGGGGGGDEEDEEFRMDVDELPGRGPQQTRRFSGLPSRRRSSPVRRGNNTNMNTDDAPSHLARLEFEDFSLYPPAQASHAGRFDPANPLSLPHGRAPNEHPPLNSRMTTNTTNAVPNSRGSASPTTTARLRPSGHAMVPPWELPDVSLPFGDLFETLGEGRHRLGHHQPQRSDAERSESAPSLPHPDLGGAFTGQRYAPSPDRTPGDADMTATTHAREAATMAAARHHRFALERQRQLDHEYDLMRLEQSRPHSHSRSTSEEIRSMRSQLSSLEGYGQLGNNAPPPPTTTTGAPSRASAASASASTTSQAPPGTSRAAARHEPPRPGTYSGFLPGPFRNTLLHVERHGSARNGGAAMPPSAAAAPLQIPTGSRDQRSSVDSPFTSRPLLAERDSLRQIAGDAPPPSNMFSWSRRYAAAGGETQTQTQRRGTGTWAEPEFRQLIEERDRQIEVLRRRQQEMVEARTRQLRERARYRESGTRIQESYEMARALSVGERDRDRDADGNNSSVGGETGNRTQSRRRFESLRLGAMTAGTTARRTRFFTDYMRDEDLDLLSYESLLNLTELAGDVRSRATPADILEKMEKSTYKEWKTADSETRCPICLDDYEPDDPVQKLPNCSHWLHQECLGQWLKSANTCPVCRGSVSETRPLGGRRSARTRSVFSGGLRRHSHGQTGPPPPAPGDNPGVSRFNHPVAAETSHRPTRRGARQAQPQQQVAASASPEPAAPEGNSNPRGVSAAAYNNRGADPVPSDSEDEHSGMEFLPHFYRWR